MSNVVPLSGDATPYSGEPRPHLVAALERLLEQAKSGELQGLGYVMLYRDSSASWNRSGVLGTYGLVGAALMLVDDLKEAARGDG